MTAFWLMTSSSGKESYVELFLQGGLGNQIFQYLAARKVRRELGLDTIKVNLRNYQACDLRKPEILDIINMPVRESGLESALVACIQWAQKRPVLAKIISLLISPAWGIYHIDEQDSSVQNYLGLQIKLIKRRANLARTKARIVGLNGFWQNPLSFSAEDFHPIMPLLDQNGVRPWENLLLDRGLSYVAIHIRRGDYSDATSNMLEYNSRHSQLQYMISALAILPVYSESMPIVIVTDDQVWCKKWAYNLRLSAFSDRVQFTKSLSTWHDWIVLAAAEIVITSNSTFSFTAAWLGKTSYDNQLRIIMPEWYSRTVPMHKKGWSEIPGTIAI